MSEYSLYPSEVPQIKEFDLSPEWKNEMSIEILNEELEPFFSQSEIPAENPHEYVNEREFGIAECAEGAKEIFDKEVISEWRNMSLEKRNEIVQKYEAVLATGLGIEACLVSFEPMPDNVGGRNKGDGIIHLNSNLLTDPQNVIKLIDVVAHETRHQYQIEVVRNPDDYNISPEVVQEWAFGLQNYSTDGPTMYDPWGYFYNPVEGDSRFFGESMVREVTKEIIAEMHGGSSSKDFPSHGFAEQSHFFVNDRDWHIKQADKALDRGDMSAYNDHMSSAKICSK